MQKVDSSSVLLPISSEVMTAQEFCAGASFLATVCYKFLRQELLESTKSTWNIHHMMGAVVDMKLLTTRFNPRLQENILVLNDLARRLGVSPTIERQRDTCSKRKHSVPT